MKRFLWIPLLWLTVFSWAGCGVSEEDPSPHTQPAPELPGGNEEEPEGETTPAPDGRGRYLVLYCSRTGNTEQVAKLIQQMLGCDICKVEPQRAYESDYSAMLGRAQEELAAIGQGNYPAITTEVENIEAYDLIFIGYPIWYDRIATPMQTFLHTHAAALAGKRLALFATSGSSGIGTSVAEAAALCPDARLQSETLLLTSATLAQGESRVGAWLDRLGVRRLDAGEGGEKDEEGKDEEGKDDTQPVAWQVNITCEGRTFTATFEDNAASRDFLSRLPLDVTLNDYNGMEKIFYPSPALTTEGVTRGCTPLAGDITIYVPWGNVAIFYKDGAPSTQLIRIGRIDGKGIEALAVAGSRRLKFAS